MRTTDNGLPGAPGAAGDDPAPVPPPENEEAARAEVRRRAQGLTHHQVKAALKDARSRLSDDPRGSAELEEWVRIVRLLADQAGPYDPDTDAFLQGELAARADRGRGRGTGNSF